MARGRRNRQPFAARKARDRAFVLPLLGLVLFMPPLALIFQRDTQWMGVPLPVLYIFVVWLLLIVGAALLSRRLRDDEDPDVGSPEQSTSEDDRRQPDSGLTTGTKGQP